MKKHLIGMLLSAILAVLCFTLLACGQRNSMDKGGFEFSTLNVDGRQVYGVVSNATDKFDFSSEVTGDVEYIVALDEFGINTSATKVVPLRTGDNDVYLFVMNGGEIIDTYLVTIRRRPIYTVSFNTNGATAIDNQFVEEGFCAVAPESPSCLGCEFIGWDYDFTTPITQPTKITAQFEATAEMSLFEFTSTSTICSITGIKDKTVTEIIIPNCVTSIGDLAFADFYNLTSVEIPDSVTSIGDTAFYHCYNLTSVEIPDSVTSIGDSAFYGCERLTYVVIGDGVTSIGDWAFNWCESLASVVVGDNVSSIGERAFPNRRLVEVVNKSSHIKVTKGSDDNGCIGEHALAVYNSGDTFTGTKVSNDNGYVVYMNGTEKILVGYNGTETDLVLPSYITKINNYAFYNDGMSLYKHSLRSVVIPDGVASIGDYAFYWCESLGSVEIPDSVTSIGNYAFYLCESLGSVVIGDSVTSIGEECFANCYNLRRVELPDGVISISETMFAGCNSLKIVVIPDGVTSIGDGAFYYCSSLILVYYKGTSSEWSDISIGSYNTSLTNAMRYYYSETEPTTSGNYWHYDENGNIVIW